MDSLKRQLFLTHSKPALLSAMGLSVAIIVVAVLYYFSASLIDTVLPNAIRTNKLKVSINKSESLLRQWVLIKDADARTKRRQIWQDEIKPSISLLIENYRDKNQEYNVEIIETAHQLQEKLVELRDIQWWIEDITYYNDSNLAKYFLDKNISSVFDNLDKLLESLHPNQKKNNKVKEKILITQKHLLKSFHLLTNTITYRETTSKEQFFYVINITERLINDLNNESYIDIESQRILEWLQQEFDHYCQQSLKAINLRYSQYWDGSLQQLETNKRLLEFEVDNLISSLSYYENAKLEKKTSDLSDYLWLFLIGGIVFIIFLQACSLLIAKLAAEYYTSRLNTLTEAAASLTRNNAHNFNPIGNDEIGRLMGVFNSMKDAIKNREDKLTLQRNDINQLTRIVTHDMKPPIINIKGHAKIIAEVGETLISKSEFYEKQYKHFSTIEKSIDYINKSVVRIDELINGVLKHSTLSDRELNSEEINIKALIEEILDLNSSRLKGANIEVFKEFPSIISDAFVLKFNFSTLIDNAINYQDVSRPLKVSISFLEDEEFYTIAICDNGIGISEHQQSNLFQLSNKSSKDGSFGVGLASARMLMRRIRGDLIYSTPTSNIGSIFSIKVSKKNKLQ